jgi:TonB family protein
LGFEEEAIEAIRQWRYEPGRQNGVPVDVYFTVVVEFVLQ